MQKVKLKSNGKVFASIFAILLSFIGPAWATNPSFMLNNEKLRFGGGGQGQASYSYVNSINASGLLQQPFYRSTDAQSNPVWYKLTFSSNPLNMMIATGTGSAHWSGEQSQPVRQVILMDTMGCFSWTIWSLILQV